MSLLIKPTSVDKIKESFIKILLSRTNLVTKVSDGSVLNGIAYGNAKTGMKAMKDIALAQSRYYPLTTYGAYLDEILAMFGMAPRFGALGSSTYVRVSGAVGTTYTSGVNTFKSSTGIVFNIDTTTVIGAVGFAYIKVSSSTTGSNTNVEANLIDTVSPVPVGHQYVTNEYGALNGRDIETDDQCRDRITSGINSLARPTLEYLKQVMLKFDSNILRVFNYGITANGKVKLGVATQNGSDLTPTELTNLTANIKPWLSLSELNPDGFDNVGIELVNITWEPIDISFRCDFDAAYDPYKIRVNAQIRCNKYMDYRTWVSGSVVQWDDLLQIIKSTEGMRFVPDQYFFPSQDLNTQYGKLPRIRGFQMLDMNGALISGTTGNLNPVYYPAVADFNFISTVLANL